MHQYVVDAYAAQTACASDKPIRLAFALVGLYLHVELGLNGRQVQRVHTVLARRKRPLPSLDIPESRGVLSMEDVLDAAPGPERNHRIEAWCQSVWDAYGHNRDAVVGLLGDLAVQNP